MEHCFCLTLQSGPVKQYKFNCPNYKYGYSLTIKELMFNCSFPKVVQSFCSLSNLTEIAQFKNSQPETSSIWKRQCRETHIINIHCEMDPIFRTVAKFRLWPLPVSRKMNAASRWDSRSQNFTLSYFLPGSLSLVILSSKAAKTIRILLSSHTDEMVIYPLGRHRSNSH